MTNCVFCHIASGGIARTWSTTAEQPRSALGTTILLNVRRSFL